MGRAWHPPASYITHSVLPVFFNPSPGTSPPGSGSLKEEGAKPQGEEGRQRGGRPQVNLAPGGLFMVRTRQAGGPDAEKE
jgi:hypothetical protein